MNKFLSEIKGFTPVIDILAQELGLMTAVVYGIVWRYCQMKDRVCKASLDKIAQHAGISRKTVKRHIVKLCDAGYLIDLTPEEDHAPHLYADTGRAKIIGLLSAEVDTSESEVGQRVLPPRSESPTRRVLIIVLGNPLPKIICNTLLNMPIKNSRGEKQNGRFRVMVLLPKPLTISTNLWDLILRKRVVVLGTECITR